MYSKTLFAGWSDMDFYSHMRNTAFLDKSADVRMMYFAEHGFPVAEFARLKLGPVVMKDEVEYRKEVGLLQEITVTLAVAGLSPDGSRFVLRNEILRPDGTLCARVTSAGGWLDLAARKLVAPPAPLLAALQSLPRTLDFAALPPGVRERGKEPVGGLRPGPPACDAPAPGTSEGVNQGSAVVASSPGTARTRSVP